MEEWLRSIGLGDRIAAFRAQSIASDQLAELTEADLRELGLTIGERKRFARALAALNGQLPEATQAERRPLTMMFIDMVGSSRISEQLDPEDQMAMLEAYRAFCGGVVERFGGHIARVVGDGILAYFCYPVANENDPERAVRAGLVIARDAGGVPTPAPSPIQVRIGIATGRVIVSDLFAGSRETDRNSIIGATPNLAARLQSLAPPGGVVVAAETHARIRHLFACEDLGVREMRGFDARHHAWQVAGDLPPHARTFVLPRPRRLTPCFGRAAEQARIAARWEQAKAGQGGAALLMGEAGIGKSRLIEDFLAHAMPEGGGVVQLAASAFDQDSALHPASAFLRAAAGIAAEDAGHVKRAKLAAVLFGDAAERARALPVLARLLDIPTPDGEAYEALAPERLRERTLSVLTRQMCVRAEHRPLCVVVEDLHWLDPTSAELLARLVERAAGLPMLVLATAREGFDAPWMTQPGASVLRLIRLGAEAVSGMVDSLFAGQEVPAHVTRLIASRTDGVPLFVEEVARALLQAQERSGGALPDPGAIDEPDGAIPASLHEALMARLDRSGPAKQIAQAAAVAGRTVRRDVLAAVSGLPAAEMEDGLGLLTGSGLLFRDDAPGMEAYTFGHALMRDAAYDTLLRDRKRGLHLTIARALPRLDPESVERQPEVLALHLTEGGEADEAAPHWEEAARRGLARSALSEATRLLRRGLAALRAGEPTPERLRLRLRLETLLGPALMGLYGLGSPEAAELYEGAVSVCRDLDDDPAHFPFYWGSWLTAPRPRVKRARAVALLEQARSFGEPGLLLEAHHCNWVSEFLAGDFGACREHADRGLDIYHAGDFSGLAHAYGNHDPKVCVHGTQALVLWMQGRLRGADEEERRSMAWAAEVKDAGSQSYARELQLQLRAFRRDFAGVIGLADDMAGLAAEHLLAEDRAKALFYHGWATAMTSDPAKGLRMMEEAAARTRDSSIPSNEPLYAALRAEAMAQEGEADAADEMLAREAAECIEIGLRFWLPELLRIRAEMIVAHTPAAIDRASALLAQAAEVAREQGAPMLGLRAAVPAARLDLRNGAAEAAVLRLDAALRAVPEDDGSQELAHARQLLRAWRGRVPETVGAGR